MEKVSAIITTHNRCELLKKALKSVLNQTYKNIECIIVNDNSTDDTEEYLSTIKDNIVKVINIDSDESRGGNYARNRGIDASEGKYIAFLDDDDLWMPEKIEKQVECFEKNEGLGLVYCGHEDSYLDGRYRHIVIPSNKMRGSLREEIFAVMICTSSMMMVPKDILIEVGMFDETVKFWQDYDLCIRICKKYKVDFVDEPLMILRHDINDKYRMSNKLTEWSEAVHQQNKKYSKEINSLDPKIKKARQLMIYIDAWYRCDIVHDKKKMRHYAYLIWKQTYNPKYIVSALLGIGHVFLVKMKGFI